MLLESVLVEQLRKLNRIRFKGQEYEFSSKNEAKYATTGTAGFVVRLSESW